MALVDSSYFIGPISIPGTNKPEVSQRLQFFIDKYEAELLEDIFGYEMYSAYVTETADYDVDGSNPTIPARWLNIIEGVQYQKSGKTRKFKGLLYEIGTHQVSLIANYIYWFWIKDQYTQTVGLGEVKAKAENADNENPSEKIIRAWNDMSEQIEELYWYLQEAKDTYPEWEKHDRYRMLRKFQKLNLFGF